MMRRTHPFMLAVLTPLFARAISIVAYGCGSDAAGHPTLAAPLSSLVLWIPDNVLSLAGPCAALLLLWNVIPRARRVVALVAVGTALTLSMSGEVDRQMLRFLGQGLTLTTLRTYGASSLVSLEVFQPLLRDWPHLALSLAIVLATGIVSSIYARRAYTTASTRNISWWVVAIAAACPIPAVTGAIAGTPRPAELTMVRALFGRDATPPPRDEIEALQTLRKYVCAKEGTRWLDMHLPLVHEDPPPSQGRSTRPLPDIILLVVESLRGQDVGFASGRVPSITPTLDALAARGISFPRYIANGFSTASAFMTIHTSMWPHRHRLLSAELTDIKTDAFPSRLGALGYESVFVSGSNPDFANMMLWLRRWYARLDFEARGNRFIYSRRMSDRELIDRLIYHLEAHERATPKTPLLLTAFTAGMHTPFTLEDSYFVPLSAAGDAEKVDVRGISDPQERYDTVLSNFDTQLARLVEIVEARMSHRPTVLVILGDHSYFTTERYNYKLRGMPIDPIVWTSAVIIGPEELVGPPSRVQQVRSHVDVLPTLLHLANDFGPTAAVGCDLLGTHEPQATLAIRPDGMRLDRGGYSVVFPLGQTSEPWAFVPFHKEPMLQPSLAGTPFTQAELQAANHAVDYWSYLIENNRVWR